MNRRGSKNISAIEDRILSQTERAAQIRAEAAAEAADMTHNRAAAQMFSNVAIVDRTKDGQRNLPRGHGSNLAVQAERAQKRAQSMDDVENRRVARDTCFNCGVRQDKHREFGCKRWRST